MLLLGSCPTQARDAKRLETRGTIPAQRAAMGRPPHHWLRNLGGPLLGYLVLEFLEICATCP